MVEAFNAANDIDRIEVNPREAWLGVVAVGTAYDALRQALAELRLTEAVLMRAGIRILRVGMPYPLGSTNLLRLASGIDCVLVVEDKLSFVELQVKDFLYGRPDAPRVIGKRDHNGRLLIPADGELTAARLTGPLRRLLEDRVELAPPPRPTLELSVLPSRRSRVRV